MLAISALAFVVLYIAYYLYSAIRDTHLYCGSVAFAGFLRASCPSLDHRYWPNPFILNGHLMTRFCSIFRGKLPKVTFVRQLLPTPDGGQVSLDWYAPGEPDYSTTSLPSDPRTVALFLPGIAGNSSAEYLRTLIPVSYQLGYRPVVLNYRGLTSTPLLNSRLYCALNTDDLETVLGALKDADPSLPIVGVALSMGATILTAYLCKTGTASLVDAAFLASAVWDTQAGARNLERGFMNRDLNKTMTRMLLKTVNRHRSWFEDDPNYDLKRLAGVKTLRQFDDQFTRKMFNFPSVDAYYEACSHQDKVHLIQVPTLAIQAADDPMAPEKDLPKSQVSASSHVAMVITPRGGHLGFMDAAKTAGQTTYYLERLCVEYLKGLLALQPDSPRCASSSSNKTNK